MNTSTCPCCRVSSLESLYPDFTGTCITSDMQILPESSLANRLCVSCGLIFNAGGTRGQTEEYYANSYSLMTRNESARIQNFAGGAPKSQAERSFDILHETAGLADSGNVLEIGAGKGEFLTYFERALPAWKITAFEPSTSFAFLAKSFSSAHLQKCDYSGFESEDESFDAVVALGVLEHVEDPLDMLAFANAKLRYGGTLYIRVPNFGRNPNDLFCADHLSKLTVPTLRSLLKAAGFDVVAVEEKGVPVFVTAKKNAEASRDIASAVDENRTIVESNVTVANGIVDSVFAAREKAASDGTAFAIFGLGSSGLFAPFFGNFSPEDIAAYVDENTSVHGSTIHGRTVVGLDMIRELNIGHIALAISPVYFEQVAAKLVPHGVSVHKAEVDA